MNNYTPTWMKILKHAVIWLTIVFCMFPILWALSASFNPANTLVGQPLIPEEISFSNYETLFTSQQHPFATWLFNSVKIALIASFGSVALTTLAAYPFSRFNFWGRRNGLFMILLVQVFPQMLAMVALYLLFLNVQTIFPAIGINTHPAVIITYMGGAIGVNTWLMKGYMDTIPRSIEDAAFIDGASGFQIFYRIILPLSKPILGVLFVIQFIASYSEYVLARVLLNSTDRLTLAVGLHLFVAEDYGGRWGVFSAAAMLGAIPIIILFMLVQDHIVTGFLSGGGVKG